MATLYRCHARTNVVCACGRAARALRRAGIEHETVRVPTRRGRRPEVQALTGQDRVPVLVIDGQAICDSHRIAEYVRDRSRGRSAA